MVLNASNLEDADFDSFGLQVNTVEPPFATPPGECHSLSLSLCAKWDIMPANDDLAARLFLITPLSFTAA